MAKKSKYQDSLGRINSANNTPTQITTLCEQAATAFAGMMIVEVVKRVEKEKGLAEALVVDLMLTNGCRISEVLRIRPEDILSEHRVLVRGLKHSADRICSLSCSWSLNKLKCAESDLYFGRYNRYYFYRLFKEYGIYGKVKGNKKQAVTHFPRHVLASSLASCGCSPEVIQKEIGHKSRKSTEHYLEHEPYERGRK